MEFLLTWLATPISGLAAHSISGWEAWHARLMVLAWGILLPVGAIAARFFKVEKDQDWPRQLDSKFWWHAHCWLQGIAVIAMTAGLLLVLGVERSQDQATSIHALLGWLLCITGWLQVVAGVFRGSKGGPTESQLRGDHYDMSRWRIWFERIHKSFGWLAIAGAVPTIAIGLKIADAPRWMPVTLILWWIGLGIWCARLQLQGRCMDTYQAIWGPDASLPGNRIPPVGWGVRRYSALSWRERFVVGMKKPHC